MTEDDSQMDDSKRASPRVSIRFVLCVLLGMYLAGFGMYRLNNDPPDHTWLAFRYHNPTLSDYLRPFEAIWESDDSAAIKVFHTLYSPCYAAEEWVIYKVLW